MAGSRETIPANAFQAEFEARLKILREILCIDSNPESLTGDSDNSSNASRIDGPPTPFSITAIVGVIVGGVTLTTGIIELWQKLTAQSNVPNLTVDVINPLLAKTRTNDSQEDVMDMFYDEVEAREVMNVSQGMTPYNVLARKRNTLRLIKEGIAPQSNELFLQNNTLRKRNAILGEIESLLELLDYLLDNVNREELEKPELQYPYTPYGQHRSWMKANLRAKKAEQPLQEFEDFLQKHLLKEYSKILPEKLMKRALVMSCWSGWIMIELRLRQQSKIIASQVPNLVSDVEEFYSKDKYFLIRDRKEEILRKYGLL